MAAGCTRTLHYPLGRTIHETSSSSDVAGSCSIGIWFIFEVESSCGKPDSLSSSFYCSSCWNLMLSAVGRILGGCSITSSLFSSIDTGALVGCDRVSDIGLCVIVAFFEVVSQHAITRSGAPHADAAKQAAA